MNRFLRRFRELLKIHLQPFLQLSVTPPGYVGVLRPEWATAEVPAPPESVECHALEGRRQGRLAFVLDDILGTAHARYEVFRMVTVAGAPTLMPVTDSGPEELQPALWTWSPPCAGIYRIRATRMRDDGTLLSAQIDNYSIPLQIKLEAHRRAGGVRLIVTSVTNQIPASILPGLMLKFMFAAVRTDLANQTAVWRSFLDADDSDPACEFDLEPGAYTLLATVGQHSEVNGFAAMGDQVVMNFRVD